MLPLKHLYFHFSHINTKLFSIMHEIIVLDLVSYNNFLNFVALKCVLFPKHRESYGWKKEIKKSQVHHALFTFLNERNQA